MDIFIGNLSSTAKEEDIYGLFEQFGEVDSVNMKKGARGHAFVVMSNAQEGHDAIEALTGQSFMGRPINISIRESKR